MVPTRRLMMELNRVTGLFFSLYKEIHKINLSYNTATLAPRPAWMAYFSRNKEDCSFSHIQLFFDALNGML